MAKTEELFEGLVFTIPDPPKKNSEILYSNLSKKDQRWKRSPLPDNFISWSKEKQDAFAFEENRKCKEGIFFYNYGEVVYITGDHYFYLQWFKIDGGYPDYRDRDRRWYYHWFLCDNDIDCLGQDYGKLRRDGYSFRVDAIILNRARKTFDSNYGIVSKTGDDAKEMFQKLVHGFVSLPYFFKPQVESGEQPKKELIFRTPQKRITHKNRFIAEELSLNTKTSWTATTENAFDGTKQKIIAADEAGKWTDVNVEKWFNIAKTCVMLGGKIIGKILFGSTVNESTKGGDKFKSIWDKSCVNEKTANGRTLSGLWRYFVPAYDGLEGFIDEYGRSVIDTPESPIMGIDGHWIKIGAKPYLEAERAAKYDSGDIVGYYEEIRQRPFTVDEMFRDPANEQTQFDLDKIYQQINHNDSVSENPLRRGNFVWKNAVPDSEVVFQEDNNGKWLVSWFPKVEDRNKHVVKFGKKAPANTHDGLFSVDPFDHRYVSGGKQSKAASHGIHKYSFNDPNVSNTFISQYWGRPKDPAVFYEDMLMQCVFYGWEILGESNKPGCINHFRNRGYDNYLMRRPAFTHNEHSEKKQEEVWIPNTGTIDKGIRRMLVEHMQSYVYQYIGNNSITGIMGNCKFNDTLHDLVKFDIEKWTDYDLTVSAMYAVLGLNTYQPKKLARKTIKLFEIYDTTGVRSVLIVPKKKPLS